MLRYSIELHPEVWRGPEARGRVCRLVQYPLARDLVPGVGPALPTREQRLRPRVADHPLQLGPGGKYSTRLILIFLVQNYNTLL